ncbi:hypothetical protein BDZ89DRAFT_261022 [Hymenopellis radicata]|nr:hypothetical protein BDZ89DRAFT_261022 [Hymenopellis radicata]
MHTRYDIEQSRTARPTCIYSAHSVDGWTFTPSLIDGLHRCLMMRSKVIQPLQKRIRNAEQIIRNLGNNHNLVRTMRVSKAKLEKKLEEKAYWITDVYDRDGIMEDDNASEQIIRLVGNKRLFVKPDTDANKILTMIHHLNECAREEFDTKLRLFRTQISDYSQKFRFKEVLDNPRLVRTLALLSDLEWMWAEPDVWMVMTHLRYVASHSEGVGDGSLLLVIPY